VGIDFSGPAAALPQVPAWQVLQQAEGFWRGRTMLIGATVMEALGFQPLPSPLAWLLLGGWTLLVAGTLRRGGQVGTSVAITGALLAAGLLAAGGIWAVAHRLPPVSALVAMPLLGGGLRSWSQWRQESRERAYLRQVLSRRVSDPDQPGPAGAPAGPPGGDPPRLASAQGSSGSGGGLRLAGIAQKPPGAGPPPAPGVA
jgi:adenylate cyclase